MNVLVHDYEPLVVGREERVSVSVAGYSVVGDHASGNEDHFLVADVERSALVTDSNLSADGVPAFSDVHGQLILLAHGVDWRLGGGHASRIAAEVMFRQLASRLPMASLRRPLGTLDLEDVLRGSITASQGVIDLASSRGPTVARMATTLTAAILVWPRLAVAEVGDNRSWLLRGGVSRPLTTPAPPTTVLRALSTCRPVVRTVTLQPDDIVVMCTSAVPESVVDDVFAERPASASECCRRLLARARDRDGGRTVSGIVMCVPRMRWAGPESGFTGSAPAS